jgi:TatD DNase family protein
MIDSHAHLHDPAFDEDRAEMIARANEQGVHTMITVGTDLADSARAIDVAEQFGTGVAIGIHPHEAEHAPADLPAAFQELFARSQRIVAIGEIGLDYHYEHSPRDVQKQILHAQLALADAYDLPVIFHEREALEDFVAVLREDAVRRAANGKARLRGVIHCFTRDLASARIYTEEFNLMLGIGGVLTFKTAQGLREAVQALGLDSLILETDCPYLAPVPLRGKRNEPAFMQHSAEKIAEILSCDITHVIEKTRANTLSLFSGLQALAA